MLIIEKFTLQRWNNLDAETKQRHTLNSCEPCKFIFLSSNTPTTPSASSTSVLENVKTPLTPLSMLSINISISENPVKGTDKIIAKEVATQANKIFTTHFGTLFTDVAPRVPELNLQKRLTEAERKSKVRKVQRNIKTAIEKEIHTRDTNVHYGTRQTATQ